MQQIDYTKLDYNHKLLYVRSVFDEAKSSHPVYQKLYTLISGQWKIEEKHLDMLYEQINSVVDSLHTDTIIEKMGRLAAQLEQIQKMEKIDREREEQEMIEMEKMIMMIDDDKPVTLGIRN
ncbi:hypothetical protein XF24_00008 [candidate division SR1 bacterium Aalborg_AAW-1]|nr:hypothetical protein XF24_00008 [candidate division SR1 bacterium Aalborg_AAW-1]